MVKNRREKRILHENLKTQYGIKYKAYFLNTHISKSSWNFVAILVAATIAIHVALATLLEQNRNLTDGS
jgi:hypothetical protein